MAPDNFGLKTTDERGVLHMSETETSVKPTSVHATTSLTLTSDTRRKTRSDLRAVGVVASQIQLRPVQ